jgi:hypothetical protein
MENNELKFYWYPNNDNDGISFEMNNEYVVSEINRILNENKSRKINGFFIHFGISIGKDRFNRIIIERGLDNIFKVEEQIFFKDNYIKQFTPTTTELAFKPIVGHLEEILKNNRSGAGLGKAMMERFKNTNNKNQ